MWKTKLCLGVSNQYGIDVKEQIKLFKKVGFDGFFVEWSKDIDIKAIKEYSDALGMIFQSIHAPYVKMDSMWHEDDRTQSAVKELIDCAADCAENDIPIMVCHAFIGFERHEPTSQGVENFKKVVEFAAEHSVKIAFENTEGDEYLAVIMEAFKNYENVGFCWDTGHEMCYNHSKDMTALYGDRIICTHLNDNLGIKDFNGKITYIDDLHLLPFDGIADWNNIVNRLNRCGFNDILTFELNTLSKPERHENDKYADMPIEIYVTEAYIRACRVAEFKKKDLEKQ